MYLNEGQFWQGHFEGFVRRLDHRGNCQVGFWSVKMSLNGVSPHDLKPERMPSASSIISRPYGKWAHYSCDDDGCICPEGIYRGDNRQWNRMLYQRKIDGFETNVQP